MYETEVFEFILFSFALYNIQPQGSITAKMSTSSTSVLNTDVRGINRNYSVTEKSTILLNSIISDILFKSKYGDIRHLVIETHIEGINQ